MLEQKNKHRARVRIFVFIAISVNVIGLMAMLMAGCKKPVDTTENTMETNTRPSLETNLPPVETTTAAVTNPVPPVTEIAALAPAAGQDYTVEKGDSFFSIAKKFNVTMKAVQEANPGIEPTKIRPGQKLHIPAPVAAAVHAPAPETAAAAGGPPPYIVKSGDTLTKIATDHGTTIKALRAANNLTTDKIKVGDKLKIPAKSAATIPSPSP